MYIFGWLILALFKLAYDDLYFRLVNPAIFKLDCGDVYFWLVNLAIFKLAYDDDVFPAG